MEILLLKFTKEEVSPENLIEQHVCLCQEIAILDLVKDLDVPALQEKQLEFSCKFEDYLQPQRNKFSTSFVNDGLLLSATPSSHKFNI